MFKLKVTIPALILIFAPISRAEDSPDFSKEAEFHRIYKSYNVEPTSTETWDSVLSQKQAENYNVQRGDTLSGISTTLFGDQFFWPKIWSINNPQILNPHEIKPGMVVQFFPGSLEDAPAIQIAEEKEPEKLKEEGSTDNKREVRPVVKIPPPKKRNPVLSNFPRSLPVFNSIMGVVDQKEEVQLDLKNISVKRAKEPLSYYIADQPIEGVGTVVGVEMGLSSAGEFQYIFVKLDDSGQKRFTVQKNIGNVKDTDSWWRRGNIVEVQGEIEILKKVNSDKNIYRAIVKKAINQVEVGSILTPGSMPMLDPNPGPKGSPVESNIIGGQFHQERKLFGSHSIVYLNGGESKGLVEGQTLSIFAEESVRNNTVDAIENHRIIGKLKVIKVTPYFATAYIIDAKDDILVGDHVGKEGAQSTNDDMGDSEEGVEEKPVKKQKTEPKEDSEPEFDQEEEFDSEPEVESQQKIKPEEDAEPESESEEDSMTAPDAEPESSSESDAESDEPDSPPEAEPELDSDSESSEEQEEPEAPPEAEPTTEEEE